MKRFSQLVMESKSAGQILQSEITAYINKVKKLVPGDVNNVLAYLKKYNILDKATVEEIKTLPKTKLVKLADNLSISHDDILYLQDMLKKLGRNINLLPMYMTNSERKDLENGTIIAQDLTLDLESRRGREAAAKMYYPYIKAIVNKYVGINGNTQEDLMSVAFEAMTLAMNNWDKERGTKEGTSGTGSFRAYLYKKVSGDILNSLDKQDLIHVPRGKRETEKMYGASIDDFFGGNGEDKMSALGFHDDMTDNRTDDPKTKKQFDRLYKVIDQEYGQRDAVFYYKMFGLNGYDKVDQKTLVKDYGLSGINIVSNRGRSFIKWLMKNSETKAILADIKDLYMEGYLISSLGSTRKEIFEGFVNDDIYMALHEACEEGDIRCKVNDFKNQFADAAFIDEVLSGSFQDIDRYIKTRRRDLIALCSFCGLGISDLSTDVDILTAVQDLQNQLVTPVTESEESIKDEKSFREYAKAKFEEVFGDELDEKRMKFTVDGILKDNKKLVDAGDWGALVGKLNKSFG